MGKWSDSEWTQGALIGGHPALDFANTAGGRTKLRDVARLTVYAVFLRWSGVARLISEAEAQELWRLVEQNPDDAESILASARVFREALHACLMAEQDDQAWPGDCETHVLTGCREAIERSSLHREQGTYRWHASLDDLGVKLPAVRVALEAEALLRDPNLARMKNCDRCSWLFIDKGRGRPRRWCSMAACGSRAKSARYYRKNAGA